MDRARRHLQGELKSVASTFRTCCILLGEVTRCRKRILVAIDDSTPVEWAVAVAGRPAEELSARVMLLHVVEPVAWLTVEIAYVPEDVDRERRQQGEGLLDRAERSLSRSVEADYMMMLAQRSSASQACGSHT